MDFSRWLAGWLKRHPLKDSRDLDPARYTAEVMARVRALEPQSTSAASPLRWLPWPRLALTLATAAAGLLVAVGVVYRSASRLADQIDQEAQVLASLDDTVLVEPLVVGEDELVDEMEAQDLIVLAEEPASDDAWVNDTLKLLDQLDDELPADDSSSSDDWMNELEVLDDSELAANS